MHRKTQNSTIMKTNRTYIAIVFTLLICCGFTSCIFFSRANNVLVGHWACTDYGTGVNYSATFENSHKCYLRKHHVDVFDDESGHNIVHYIYRYYGKYDLSEDIVTLHYTKIEHNHVVYLNHEKVVDNTISLPVYDEKAKYETDEKCSILTLVRNFGTDSIYTQEYHKEYIK